MKAFFDEFELKVIEDNIQLIIEYPLDIGILFIDKVYFRQILWHLISQPSYVTNESNSSRLKVTRQIENAYQTLRFEVISPLNHRFNLFLDEAHDIQNKHDMSKIDGYQELRIAIAYYLCQIMGGTLEFEVINTDEVHFIVELPLSENL